MENQENQVISTGDWMITILITAIPFVGFIMLFVWAFSSSTLPTKANWAKATLIWLAIFIALYVVLFLVFGAAILAGMQQS